MTTAFELGCQCALEKIGSGLSFVGPSLWNRFIKPVISPGTVALEKQRTNYAKAEKMKNELFDSIKPTVEYKNPFLVPIIEEMPSAKPSSADAAKLVPSANHYPSSPLASKLDPYSVRDGVATGDKAKQLNDILGVLQRNFVPKGADAQAKITDMYRRLGLAGLTVGGAGATGAAGYALSGKDTPDTPQAPTPATDLRNADELPAAMQQQRNVVETQEQPKAPEQPKEQPKALEPVKAPEQPTAPNQGGLMSYLNNPYVLGGLGIGALGLGGYGLYHYLNPKKKKKPDSE